MRVSRDRNELEKELKEPVQLDETELNKYIKSVIREAGNGSKPNN